MGKLALFGIFLFLTLLIILFFSFTPFYSSSTARNYTMEVPEGWASVCAANSWVEDGWVDSCELVLINWDTLCTDYREPVLASLGLS